MISEFGFRSAELMREAHGDGRAGSYVNQGRVSGGLRVFPSVTCACVLWGRAFSLRVASASRYAWPSCARSSVG